MKARRYHIFLTALLVSAMLSSAALAVPEQSPKTNFKPRKKKLTVAHLKETYGKPFFHIEWEEETSETIYGEDRKKFGKINYDEEIAFKIDRFTLSHTTSPKTNFWHGSSEAAPPTANYPNSCPAKTANPNYRQVKN